MLAVGMALVVTSLAGSAGPIPIPSPDPSTPVQAHEVSPSAPSTARGDTTAETPAPPDPPAHSSPTPSAGVVAPSIPPPTGQLSLPELLALLQTTGEVRTGYDRSLFPHWIDADGDGCNTRREVLIDEAVVPPSIGADCHLTGGQWLSLYDGVETTDAGTFDIDHVVALAEAWDSGASAWSLDRRTRFANDLDVEWSLIAVSANSNRSKSDQDPANWLPPSVSARCDYLAMWLAVKVRWSLSIDAAERTAIDNDVTGCSQRMPVELAP